jgi:hypothetical protein
MDRVMSPVGWLALLFLVGGTAVRAADPLRVLDKELYYLGSEGDTEWQEFEGRTQHSRRLDVKFTASKNDTEQTLFIRQRDVKLEWNVELNGRTLGRLFLMEADLVQSYAIPVDALRDGDNTLSILPPKERDDIQIGGITLDSRPPKEALGVATLAIQVRDDESHLPLPCRLTVVNQNGSLFPFHSESPQPSTDDPRPSLAIRPGVIYTGNGTALLGVQAGRYTIYASRGFEYGVCTQQVVLKPGEKLNLRLPLRREVPTPGLVSCDTHVHTFTHSRHGDATEDERMLTLAGEGIELPIATDHDFLADYSEAAGRMKVRSYFTPVIGCEVTTRKGHFNIFPVQPGSRVPNPLVEDWPRLMESIRATPGVRVAVLNHPRNVHNGFQPFAPTNFNAVSGENLRGPEFTFDCIELVNSSALQSDLMLAFRDWFALLNHGYRIFGVGSSDCHDVSRYIVGQGRTYVKCKDDNAGNINVEEACEGFRQGRLFISMGLLTQITVDDKFNVGDLATGMGELMRVTVSVLGPLWTSADRVELYANGVKIREQHIDSPVSPVEKARITWIIPRPPYDAHLVAIASGPPVTGPFWAIPKPYQPTSRVWEPRVLGATNPIWVDGDGDGEFTAPREYAKRVVAKAGDNLSQVISELAKYDEAVAAQTASFCQAAGRQLLSPEFEEALKNALPHVQRGFAAYVQTLASQRR